MRAEWHGQCTVRDTLFSFRGWVGTLLSPIAIPGCAGGAGRGEHLPTERGPATRGGAQLRNQDVLPLPSQEGGKKPGLLPKSQGSSSGSSVEAALKGGELWRSNAKRSKSLIWARRGAGADRQHSSPVGHEHKWTEHRQASFTPRALKGRFA